MFKAYLFIIFENCLLFLTKIKITRKKGKICLVSLLFFLTPIFKYKRNLFIIFLSYLIISIYFNNLYKILIIFKYFNHFILRIGRYATNTPRPIRLGTVRVIDRYRDFEPCI